MGRSTKKIDNSVRYVVAATANNTENGNPVDQRLYTGAIHKTKRKYMQKNRRRISGDVGLANCSIN